MAAFNYCEICGKKSTIPFCKFCKRCKTLVDAHFKRFKTEAFKKTVNYVKFLVKGIDGNE